MASRHLRSSGMRVERAAVERGQMRAAEGTVVANFLSFWGLGVPKSIAKNGDTLTIKLVCESYNCY